PAGRSRGRRQGDRRHGRGQGARGPRATARPGRDHAPSSRASAEGNARPAAGEPRSPAMSVACALRRDAIERRARILDPLAELYQWRRPGDGYVTVAAAAKAMGVGEAEVVRLARQGALAV